MPAKPFRCSVVLLLVLTLAVLAPASVAAAGPLDPGSRHERGAASRPAISLWTMVFALVERFVAVVAADSGGSTGAKPTTGATLDPSGTRTDPDPNDG